MTSGPSSSCSGLRGHSCENDEKERKAETERKVGFSPEERKELDTVTGCQGLSVGGLRVWGAACLGGCMSGRGPKCSQTSPESFCLHPKCVAQVGQMPPRSALVLQDEQMPRVPGPQLGQAQAGALSCEGETESERERGEGAPHSAGSLRLWVGPGSS